MADGQGGQVGIVDPVGVVAPGDQRGQRVRVLFPGRGHPDDGQTQPLRDLFPGALIGSGRGKFQGLDTIRNTVMY